jgi:hypothetical protein
MNNKELEKKTTSILTSLIYEKGYICSIDVLVRLDYLTKKDYQDWQFGRIPYLEKVCKANLKKLSLINRLIRKFAEQRQLKKSLTDYNQKATKEKRRLIFSKSADPNIEALYATHFIDNKRIDELKREMPVCNMV